MICWAARTTTAPAGARRTSGRKSSATAKLGDKIVYHNENDINWIGVHLQAEKSSPAGSFYGMAGWSRNAYDFTDFFTRGVGGVPLEVSSGGLTGYQVKGGAVRNMGPEWSVYGNAGLVSKVPIFDGAIDDRNGLLIDNPKNETFLSFEAGTRFRSLNRKFSLDANLYVTQWNDRTSRRFVRDFFGEGEDAVIRMLGMDARHMGMEVEGAFRPSDYMRFDAALSWGDWKHTDDIQGSYASTDRQSGPRNTPSTSRTCTWAMRPSSRPPTRCRCSPPGGSTCSWWARPSGSTTPTGIRSRAPRISTRGFSRGARRGTRCSTSHASYRLSDEMAAPFGGNVKLFIHGFNIFDQIYIQDATDNSRFNGYWDSQENNRGPGGSRLGNHKADDAEVFMGYPRTFNFGFQISH